MTSFLNTSVFLFNALVLFFIIEHFVKKHCSLLPTPLVLVFIGFLLSETWVSLELDTGIRWHSLHGYCLNTFIPLIVFATAIRFKLSSLKFIFLPTITLALPLVFLSILLIAVGLYFGIGHEFGFPWVAAFIAASLLSATETGYIRQLIKTHFKYERVTVMLEAESLFKDVTAVSLFLMLIVSTEMEMVSVNILLSKLVINSVLGLLLGFLLGLVFLHTRYAIAYEDENFILSFFLAMLVFYLSTYVLGLSGVMSLLAFAWTIQISKYGIEITASLEKVWSKLARLAVYCIFILAGATIKLDMFTEQWLAMLIAIVVCLLVRWINIYAVFGMLGKANKQFVLEKHEKQLLLGSSLRGSITLALALTIPIELDYWYTIQSMAYGVVVFSLLIQLPLMQRLILGK